MAAKRVVETIAPTGEATDAATDTTVETMTNTAVETIETAETSFTETVSALKDGMSGAAAGFEKTQSDIKEKMEKAMKTVEEVVSFSQGNMEAIIKSGQIWTAGVQDLGKSMAATAQAQLDQTISTWKALSGVKSLKDAFDLQSSLARSSVESFVAETGKLTDASLKLTEQAMAPLTARVSVAVEKFGSVNR